MFVQQEVTCDIQESSHTKFSTIDMCSVRVQLLVRVGVCVRVCMNVCLCAYVRECACTKMLCEGGIFCS